MFSWRFQLFSHKRYGTRSIFHIPGSLLRLEVSCKIREKGTTIWSSKRHLDKKKCGGSRGTALSATVADMVYEEASCYPSTAMGGGGKGRRRWKIRFFDPSLPIPKSRRLIPPHIFFLGSGEKKGWRGKEKTRADSCDRKGSTASVAAATATATPLSFSLSVPLCPTW